MPHQNFFSGLIQGAVICPTKLGTTGGTVTLSGNLTLGTESETVQVLDPGGTNRDVTLPAEANSKHLAFFIINKASSNENLVVKNDSGTTIATLSGVSGGTNNARGLFICDGAAWHGMQMAAD